MRHLMFLFILPLILFVGCDGDGGGEDDVAVDGAVGDTDEGDGGGDGIDVVRFWAPLIETGGTVNPGTHFIGGVNAPGPGTLRCVYTWTAPPTDLTCWLEQYSGGSGSSPQVTDSSPVTVTTHVDGGSWSPYILNGFSVPVYVSVDVDFMAD